MSPTPANHDRKYDLDGIDNILKKLLTRRLALDSLTKSYKYDLILGVMFKKMGLN